MSANSKLPPDWLASLHRAADEQGRLLGREAEERLTRLALFCPVYRGFLSRFPETAAWLEDPFNREETYRTRAFNNEWAAVRPPDGCSADAYLQALQRFRRKMSMRIAYRDLNGLATMRTSLKELSRLAIVTVSLLTDRLRAQWERRLGQPWNVEEDRPAQFCVIGLGKLGGEELNFFSDIDLLFVYSGEGVCRRDGRRTQLTNSEFFARLVRDLTAQLQKRTGEGFLYYVDLRLRPGGEGAPIVRTVQALENHYFAGGDTWERLAWIRAVKVAGDTEVAYDLFESINAFRYPRNPSPRVVEEVAAVKARIEREVKEDRLGLDIKTGSGGIREVEFFVQTLQLLHAGRNPFLQTNSVFKAMVALERYGHVDGLEHRRLREAYLFLRAVENRLQMPEERAFHQLPPAGPAREVLAESFGLSVEAFEERLEGYRDLVRSVFERFFPSNDSESERQEWAAFFSGDKPTGVIAEALESWFGHPAEEVAERVRTLVVTGPHGSLTRDRVDLFIALSRRFDRVLPGLSSPLRALERLNAFARRYGAPQQFLRACHEQPGFFRSLCTVFDRSRFIWELVCKHPELVEENFVGGLRRHKDRYVLKAEVAALPRDDDATFAKALWLYVKAEQVRLAMSEVLNGREPPATERRLTLLAEEVLASALDFVDPEGELLLVALGKFGSEELSFAADLDLIALSQGGDTQAQRKRLQRLIGLLHFSESGQRTYEVDMRLRPHGQDGALVVTLPALRTYHESAGRFWEKQMLLRSRPLCGEKSPPAREQIRAAFVEWREAVLFAPDMVRESDREVLSMLRYLQKQKGTVVPPERSLKTARGGIIAIEFLVQAMQLRYGKEMPQVLAGGTRRALRQLQQCGLLSLEAGVRLLDNYNFLRKVEHVLRRDSGRPVAELPESEAEQASVANWLGFSSPEAFWQDHCCRLEANGALVRKAFANSLRI